MVPYTTDHSPCARVRPVPVLGVTPVDDGDDLCTPSTYQSIEWYRTFRRGWTKRTSKRFRRKERVTQDGNSVRSVSGLYREWGWVQY